MPSKPRSGRRLLSPTGGVILSAMVAGLSLHCGFQQAPIDFGLEIRPILQERCVTCHGGVNREAGLSLLFREEALAATHRGEPAVIPGNARGSELVRRIRHSDPTRRMPRGQDPLREGEIRLIERWIDQGASWSRHWAYEPPRRPPLPPVRSAGWARNGIDRFILAELEEAGLDPSPEAECEVLIRRLSLDLTGLPPDPGWVGEFCGPDRPARYEELVDRLLASERFGERWATMWLDLARYADTKGYEKDPHRSIWKYRDWVIRAFNADLPFDRFTIEQLAGDLLPEASADNLVATAFNRNTMTNTEGGTSDEEFRVAAVVDRVNTTMEVWQGTTFHCVQCHNHPYDPFRHREFYELFAFFNNTADTDKADDRPALPTFDDSSRRAKTEVLLERIRRLEEEMEERAARPEMIRSREEWVRDARLALMFSEGRDLFGVREIPQESEVEAIIKAPDEERGPNERRMLAEYYISIAPELAPLRDEVKALVKELRALEPVWTPIMRELPPEHSRVSYVLDRGNWLTRGEAVQPAVPQALNGRLETLPPNRLGLARWLVSPENPLTARVTVNRFWAELFGTGLVETLEDFGTRGEPPSHPELLDWLAVEFIETHGWSVKSLVRQLVGSAAYRQSSQVTPMLLERDPRNRLLSRGARFRLSAEQVRDQALAVAGLLSEKMYGPSVMPAQPPGIWNSPYDGASWETSRGEDRLRRALYTYWKRTSPHPAMVTFDKPSREVTVSRRIRTNTPLQALVTLNDPVFVEAAVGFGRRMMSEAEGSPADRIRWGYRLALAREPAAPTIEDLEALYEETRDFYLHNPAAGETLVDGIDAPEKVPQLAALAIVASVILNLDEFLTRN